MTTLHLLVGLPGAGKTTLARRLEVERAALRLTPDEWMHPLFSAGESGDKRAVLEHDLLWSVAHRVLTLGVDVVLDFGFWSRQEREMYRTRAEELKVDVRLHFLDVPLEDLWLRLQARNGQLPPHTFPVTREELELWSSWFEPPSADEHPIRVNELENG